MNTIALDLHSVIDLTDEQFFMLCQHNRDLKFERTAKGKIVIMPPTAWGTGNRNIKLSTRLEIWAECDNTGIAFDSSTGFILPNRAIRSPDAAWVRQERIEAINPDPDKFLPIAPDFVVELMSASDMLEDVQAKMREYIENGVRLGWLLEPKQQYVEIYRQEREVEVLSSPTTLSGEDILPGFVLDLQGIL
ncbi:Uma2 family endonuclease [Scytonema millei]|uniref:Uma2 family endonuclease n=1 Tax=Scytonema millei VB511283 TaxID=1245923 RepID=A0A9X5I6G3_9CYAN|nr:Uma2 family endonuclease [Scytonema millei]NHC37081.1 Uma2 family endonuclease [Scytonema millei VB511283]